MHADEFVHIECRLMYGSALGLLCSLETHQTVDLLPEALQISEFHLQD